jgi:hypothetical protein
MYILQNACAFVSYILTLRSFLAERTRTGGFDNERAFVRDTNNGVTFVVGAPGLGLRGARIYFQLPRSFGLLNCHTSLRSFANERSFS